MTPTSTKRPTLAASGSYKNSGQRCTAVKRMLVHQSVADGFVDRLVAKTRAREVSAIRSIRRPTWVR